MAKPEDRPRKKGQKVRVPMRRNRAKPARVRDWKRQSECAEGLEFDTTQRESVMAKGDLSRRRTIIVPEDGAAVDTELRGGVVVVMHGLHAEVDDGRRRYLCTVPRMLRTRLIRERVSLTVGDRVRFQPAADPPAEAQGVIEQVEPRRGQLQRKVNRRIQTIVANVDQAVIVSSAAEPWPKPNLIDRYVVSALAGEMTPVICMNKIDLDADGQARRLLERYAALDYAVLCVSATAGTNVDRLADLLKDRSSVIVGQSGVGKSSLLNAIEPGLGLRVAEVSWDTQKGRHTTSSASLIRLEAGGYVVDTPGIRAFELCLTNPHELEAYYVEFVPRVPQCKFADCTHREEIGCAVKAAVESGDIHPERYESFRLLFEEIMAGASWDGAGR
jgi:ribosome biogenesis GTPase